LPLASITESALTFNPRPIVVTVSPSMNTSAT
jgi:hypothetical protein